MKRLLCVILASVIMLSFSVKANAEETTEENVMLVDVLKTANKDEIIELFEDKPYRPTMELVNMESDPMMINYITSPGTWGVTDYYSLRDILREYVKNEKPTAVEVLVLKERPGCFFTITSGSVGFWYRQYGDPTYYNALMNMKSRREFLGQEVQITNVTGYTMRTGEWDRTTLVYETDKGLFVEYYDGNDAEPVEFRWEDYIQKELAYWAYIKASYSGPFLGHVSFLDFCENPEKYVVPPEPQQPTEPQPEAPGNTQLQENKPEEKKNYTAVIVIASAVAVVALTAGAILVLRKKKR